MKKFILTICALCATSLSFAFGFGDLTKAVSEVSQAPSSSQADAFVAKQKALISNYALSKQKYAKGCEYIASCLGNEKLASQYKEAANAIDINKETDVKKIAETTDKLASGADSSVIFESAKTSLSDAAKAKYSEGLGQFSESFTLLAQIAKDTPVLAKEAKEIIQEASVTEKIKMTNAVEPTIDLGKQVTADLKSAKSKVAELIEAAKAMGIEIPSALQVFAK